ncbi:MAG: HlyD family efflux transporter periplasmic adaptor subunit [Cyclobacteriaceae bacterium]|nr:HlyD family efflux transporter periplasmic adaptor subunit [Cyclobacteriaceae bacterium]
MLNISPNSISGKFDISQYGSFKKVAAKPYNRNFAKMLIGLMLLIIIMMFVPWTQNISGYGYVTSLRPDQRPQTVHSVIGGRIESWYVQEGDFVHRGDTILYVSEIKDAYFDPQLLERAGQQIKAKELSQRSYQEKVKALDKQVSALEEMKALKLEQARNKLLQARLKVTADSIEYVAANTNFSIADRQLTRMVQLYEEGLKSLTDLESRTLKLQENQAKLIAYESKWLSSRNELINARLEISTIENDFRDKLAKANSDRYSALSGQYDSEAEVTKLENQYANYSVRQGMYFITAPQDGYITQAIQAGIGESIKEGTPIVSIMPARYDLAVEMYIEPMDLPLINKGQEVRFTFDGWPAIVFSGWPNTSYGTFGGIVVAIDNFTNSNGQYRMLVAADSTDTPWPEALRIGSGAFGQALLNDVPIGYELWRQINGFPPDYYKVENGVDSKSKKE